MDNATRERYQTDINLMQDVLQIRDLAFTLAFHYNDHGFYQAAKAENDADILGYIEQSLADATTELKKQQEKLDEDMSFHEHMHTLGHLAHAKTRVDYLTQVRDIAKANIMSGEVCYPPASKSTEELMKAVKLLQEEMADAEAASA